jgi:hypothetical protein
MPFSFVVDLHNVHILGFAYAGAQAAKEGFNRNYDRKDPLHFLHTAALLALSPTIHYASNEWAGPQFGERATLSVQIARDLGISSFEPTGSEVAEREEIAKRAAALLEHDLLYYCN